jgi:hypothetical protein
VSPHHIVSCKVNFLAHKRIEHNGEMNSSDILCKTKGKVKVSWERVNIIMCAQERNMRVIDWVNCAACLNV